MNALLTFSVVDTETPVPCRRCKSGKLCMAHVDQGPVISTLEVDFRLFLNAVVDNLSSP